MPEEVDIVEMFCKLQRGKQEARIRKTTFLARGNHINALKCQIPRCHCKNQGGQQSARAERAQNRTFQKWVAAAAADAEPPFWPLDCISTAGTSGDFSSTSSCTWAALAMLGCANSSCAV
jgi:hypothetical protein